ncbi:MAG: ribosomal protein L7/L12 [Lysobacteraceae bacterium]
MTASLPPRAQAELNAGRKIQAIKIVRESMGIGLAEAKALVDAAARRGTAVEPDASSQLADLLIPALEAFRQGRLIEAVKILRRSGLGLAEARALLEQAQREGNGAVLKPVAGHPSRRPAAHQSDIKLPLKAMLALRDGDMIGAVREYRQQHAVGLKTAKDAIDAYLLGDPLLQRQFDEAAAQRRGQVWGRTLSVLAVLMLVAAAFVAWRMMG